jgi:putative transposase
VIIAACPVTTGEMTTMEEVAHRMGARAEDAATRSERARAIGLFRYGLIREAADPGLSTRARGRLVRAVAAGEHLDPAGRRVRVSRDTLDRWIRAWRRGGFDALVPSPRQSCPRLPGEVVEMAVALKRENLDRTGAQVRRILATQMGWAPGERTLQRWFADDPAITDLISAGLSAGGAGPVFGRFEAARPNELWTGDALHGPHVGGRKTYLFAFLDDHSRAIMGHRFGFAEDTVRLAAALRPALGSRGVPDGIYVDNGSAFVDAWLLRACAKLGIRLIHSTPNRPQGRGKIERYFRTVREQFLVEITGDPDTDPSRHPVGGLGELNRLFTAWVETVYHRQIHSETGAAPLARWNTGGPFPIPSTDALAEAFLWEEQVDDRVTTRVGRSARFVPRPRRERHAVVNLNLNAVTVRHPLSTATTAQLTHPANDHTSTRISGLTWPLIAGKVDARRRQARGRHTAPPGYC